MERLQKKLGKQTTQAIERETEAERRREKATLDHQLSMDYNPPAGFVLVEGQGWVGSDDVFIPDLMKPGKFAIKLQSEYRDWDYEDSAWVVMRRQEVIDLDGVDNS